MNFYNITLPVTHRWVNDMVKQGQLWLVRMPHTCGMYDTFRDRLPTFRVSSRYGTDYVGWLFGNIALLRGDRNIPKACYELKHEDAEQFDRKAVACRLAFSSLREYEVSLGYVLGDLEEHLQLIVQGEK